MRATIQRLPLARSALALTRRIAGTKPSAPETTGGAAWFDLYGPGAIREPFADYETLRRDGPVQFLPRHGCWIVLSQEGVRAALESPGLFSSEPQRAIDEALLGADVGKHEAVRRLLARHFTTAALTALCERVRADAESLIRPRMDLVADYAVPLTRRLAAQLVGLEESEVAAILEAPDKSAPASAMSQSSRALLRRASLHARISEEAGDLLDDGDCCSLVRLLCRAATETSERLIIRAAEPLLDGEELRREIEGKGAALGQLVEEALRLWPPESNVVRLTTGPTTVAGVDLPGGAHVFLSILAANRDPDVFDDPARLKLNRSRSQHLAFSGGPHHCLGAGLGRRAAVTALQVLIDHGFRRPDNGGREERAAVQGIETCLQLLVAT